jgi:hypothetical protein
MSAFSDRSSGDSPIRARCNTIVPPISSGLRHQRRGSSTLAPGRSQDLLLNPTLETCHPERSVAEPKDLHLSPAPTFQPNTNYRFRVPDGETIAFEDLNLGPQSFTAGKDFGDFLIWRKDGVPSYQLACVVDDNAMRITAIQGPAFVFLDTSMKFALPVLLQK